MDTKVKVVYLTREVAHDLKHQLFFNLADAISAGETDEATSLNADWIALNDAIERVSLGTHEVALLTDSLQARARDLPSRTEMLDLE